MKQAASSQPKPKKLYKGVRKQKAKWVSEITLPRRLAMMPSKIWLGSFNTFEEAALAYDTAAYVLHGNSATLNFPNLAHHAASAASQEFEDSCFLENNSKGVNQGLENVQEDEMLKSSSHACTTMDGEDGDGMHECQSISGGVLGSEKSEISEKLKDENECLKKEVEVLKEKLELERVEKMDTQKECSKMRVTYSLRVCVLKRHIDFWKEKYVLMGGKIVDDDFGDNVPTQEDAHEMGHPSNGKVAKKAARRSTEIRDDNDDCASGVALNGHKMTAKKRSGATVLNRHKSSANKAKRALHLTVASDRSWTMKRKLELQKMKQTIKPIPEAGNANANKLKRKRELQKRTPARQSVRESGNANENNCSNTFQFGNAFDTSSIPYKPVTLRPCEERMSQQQGSEYNGTSGHVVDGFDLYGSEDSSNYSDSDDGSQKDNYFNKSESKGRDDKTWEHEVQMLLAFQEDTELCMKAVCALYRQHISLGKSFNESNSRGFSKLYTHRGIFLAKFLTHGNPQHQLNKSVDELHALDHTGHDECRRIAGHHASQLFEIYKNNEDPFFP